jgi:hypothetical protein
MASAPTEERIETTQEATPSRVSVSEEKLRRILVEERMEIMRELAKLATTDAVNALAARVAILELWRAARDAANATKRELTSKQLAWLGVIAGLLAIFAGLIGSVATILWLHHG